ncbi:MAG: DUF4361 domain-containing protein [Bacteroidales bacterium]|nr:DUF4361 domain-containing protein [Bacteroidales bacterium]
MKNLKIMTLAVLVWGVSSCTNRDEVFEREQYKKVFALVSGSDNVLQKTHAFCELDTGYVVVSLGGTAETDRELVVSLAEDPSLIEQYNKTNYDVDYRKYIPALARRHYEIDPYRVTVPAGEVAGRLPIKIRPGGLSPDSSYFIPLRVDSYSAYEVNPDKNFVLYSVRIKNWWATAGGAAYSVTMKIKEGAGAEYGIPGTKTVHPLSANQLRIFPGNETYESDVVALYQSAIVLTVGEDDRVTITPYRYMQVTQKDDPDYPNIFKEEDDSFKTYKTFLLRYDYTGADGTVIEVREELRLEYNAKTDKRF